LKSVRRRLKPIRRRLKPIRVRASYGMHRRVLANRASGRRFRARRRTLTDVQRAALADLQRDGIAIVSFSDLVGDAELWGALSEDMERFVDEARARRSAAGRDRHDAKDEYLVRRFDRKQAKKGAPRGRPSLPPSDPWLRLGTSGAVLDLVNAYRGLWTKLIDFDQWYTLPRGGGPDRIKSQNWHRDPEDLHVVKVFVYFSDVDDEAGPFQYIRASAEGGRYGRLWPWSLYSQKYPSPQEVAERIPPSEVVTATGSGGTIVICDTSGFHRGGYATAKARVHSYHTYVSPASLSAGVRQRRFGLDWSSPEVDLSEPARFALE
jgi:hypothetical protein